MKLSRDSKISIEDKLFMVHTDRQESAAFDCGAATVRAENHFIESAAKDGIAWHPDDL